MYKFDALEIISDYQSHSIKKQKILDDLKNIIIYFNAFNSLEGNCFYFHNSLQLCPELYSKQVNLFWCGKQAVENICEIGFNAGHSTMLMLLGSEQRPLNVTIFDIGYHIYTFPCIDYIASQFKHIGFEYIPGDSTVTMPKWIEANFNRSFGKYDVVHVDGGHTEHCISNDMKNADLLVKNGGIIIIDDTNAPTINKYVDLYLSNGNYREIDVLHNTVYSHRIIQKTFIE